MRIYTEVIFEWDDAQGKLVETSSKSFDYHGELALCTWYRKIGWGIDGRKYRYSYDLGSRGNWVNRREFHVWDGSNWVNTGDDDADNVKKKYAHSYEGRMYTKYASSTKKFETEPTETDLAPYAEELETLQEEGYTGGEDDSIKSTATDAIKGLTDNWDRIVSGDSEFHRAIKASADELARAGEGAGETYTDPITGETKSVAGTLAQAEEAYGTATTQAGEDLATAEAAKLLGETRVGETAATGRERTEEAAETERERAGVAREAGLRGARREFDPAIRAAEAAAAATGFAGTGAGESARAALAEEFREGVGDVETGFTQGIEDIDTAEDIALEDIGTTETRALEDIGVTFGAAETAEERAIAAAGVQYGGAEATFANLEAAFGRTKETQLAGAQNALRDLQTSMDAKVSTARTALNDYGWNPFTDPRSPLSTIADPAGSYGWDGSNFNESLIDTLDLSMGGAAPVIGSADLLGLEAGGVDKGR